MQQNHQITNFRIIPEDNFRQILLLLILGAIMFFLRTAPGFHLVFTDWPGDYGNFVNFASDDAVYHMRLVHNTIHHFPWRVFFDPFTHFPFGNQIHFGPLFTLIIAGISLVIGLGNPSPELVNYVGAFTPVVMGVLCLIPLYFIAKNIGGKTAAIIAAFILAFLPGEFLHRSALGFTDHHAAEVLFSTTACTFFIFALGKTKTFLKHSILSGISFGLFLLTWPAALLFGVMFLIFFITQLIIDHLKNNPTKYLLFLAIIIYGISAIMVLPYALMNPHLELTYYSLTQPLTLLAMLGIFTICYLAHIVCKQCRFTKSLFALSLLLIFILAVFVLRYYVPNLFSVITDGFKLLFEPTPAMKTVAEVRSTLLEKGANNFTVKHIWFSYFWPTLFAIIGLINLSYRIYKKNDPKEILLLIWSIVSILAALAQIRFNYYLAINVAILAGCYCIYPLLNLLSGFQPNKKIYLKLQKISLYTIFSVFVLLTVDPMWMLLMDQTVPKSPHITREYYNTFRWLKTHTPDPQGKITHKDFNYNGYYPIPKNTKIPYQYANGAYGIMAWWDIGHQLTYIAERIPNTNPFQLGIIEKDSSMGAAPFFTSTNEKVAVKNLNKTGSRYVLIDNRATHNIKGMGIWNNDLKGWSKLIGSKITTTNKSGETSNVKLPVDSTRYLQTIINRLYHNDTNGLKHFRLIHESDGDYFTTLTRVTLKPRFHIQTINITHENYPDALKDNNIINNKTIINKEKSILAYYARTPTKNIKIFEKVKGAVISGRAPIGVKNNAPATISLKLKTKYDRTFTYKQTCKIKNGRFSFTVPYPTAPMRGKDYNYDINPTNNYQIKVGPVTTKIFVSEKAVMLGKKINIRLPSKPSILP